MDKIFDINFMIKAIPKVVEAIPTTLVLLTISMILGLVLGFVLTVMNLRGNIILKSIARVYISFMRGTPPIVQLFLIYYGIPSFLVKLGIHVDSWDKLVFAILAFGLGNAAYLSEAMRSAYLAVPKGQFEAAESIGMTNTQALKRIIIPQALAVAIPNITNSLIIVFKNTSLAFSIGIIDLLGKAKMVSSSAFGAKNLEAFVAAAFIYFILCLLMEYGSRQLEKYYKKKMGLAI